MPFGPADTIRGAINHLLSSNEGFVIFDDGNENEYVQYSVEAGGLMLMWPAHGPRVASTDSGVISLLESLGFTKGKNVKRMPALTYVVEERAGKRYEEHAARPEVDPDTLTVLTEMRADEEWHLAWVAEKLKELVPNARAILCEEVSHEIPR